MFNKKLKHFKQKLANVDKALWDLEFKREKSAQVREEIRLKRDRLVETQNHIAQQVKKEGDDASKELAKVTDTLKRYEAQIDMLNAEIYGKEPTENDPGQQGINHQIDSLQELKQMVKEYIKTI